MSLHLLYTTVGPPALVAMNSLEGRQNPRHSGSDAVSILNLSAVRPGLRNHLPAQLESFGLAEYHEQPHGARRPGLLCG